MRIFLQFLRTIRPYLRYFFAVNPGGATYGTMTGLLVLCGALFVFSFVIRFWRRRITNAVTKNLSRSWSSTAFWFAIIGFLFIVCRVEGIQFLAMRFFWVLWGLGAALYLFFQVQQFRARHYRVLPKEHSHDPRERYLPKKRAH